MPNAIVHISTNDLTSAEPFATSYLMSTAAKLGFEYKVGNKSISFAGPELNTSSLSRAAKCLGLKLLPGPAPQEIAQIIALERSITGQLRAARDGDLEYRSANQALRGRGR